MTRITPADDTRAADWLVASLTEFASAVTSLVPRGFPAYLRVFHPFRRNRLPVRWAEVAAALGHEAHAGMQVGALVGVDESGYPIADEHPEVYDELPDTGRLDLELAGRLARVLAAQTSTPDRCWFALWYGYGGIAGELRLGPEFALPGRGYFLHVGPVDAAVDWIELPLFGQSANVWWPDDHAWCVATEIDLDSTYVGCSDACADALLAARGLEALRIDPAAGIDWLSDTINPPPRRG